MTNYKKLLDYIPYFENDTNEFYTWNLGYPQYDCKLNVFIEETYRLKILKGNYFEDLENNLSGKDYKQAIPTADLELLKSILTYYVRKERFCDGAWNIAVKEKIFLSILYRLREIEGKGVDMEN